jgi:hypothetical protein
MPVATADNLALVKGILEPLIQSADLRPLLDGLADDVDFRVAAADRHLDRSTGKAAVLDYFEPLGDLVTFWRASYSMSGDRVVVVADESFIIQPFGLAARSELSLVFDLRDRLVTRLLVVENTPRLAASGELQPS